jgi:hypothetical protein
MKARLSTLSTSNQVHSSLGVRVADAYISHLPQLSALTDFSSSNEWKKDISCAYHTLTNV